jgi:general secretion pathway protein G
LKVILYMKWDCDMTADTIYHAGRRGFQKGFTLIEIMVVMVILALLVAAVAPNILGRTDQARITIAKQDIRNISNALDLYRLDNHTYPSTEQGLMGLVQRPTGFPEPKNWNRDGYLKALPKDPWGNDYQYVSPGVNGAFDLYSFGSDGREGGDDSNADIGNWNLD